MRNGPETAIKAAVEKEELAVEDLLMNGRIFSYTLLTEILADENPFQRLVVLLQNH